MAVTQTQFAWLQMNPWIPWFVMPPRSMNTGQADQTIGQAAGIHVGSQRDGGTYIPPGFPPTGLTTGINKEVDPLVMLAAPPLPAAMLASSQVFVQGSGMASIDNKWWSFLIVDAGVAQFRLLGADTTSETGTGAGAEVWAA